MRSAWSASSPSLISPAISGLTQSAKLCWRNYCRRLAPNCLTSTNNWRIFRWRFSFNCTALSSFTRSCTKRGDTSAQSLLDPATGANFLQRTFALMAQVKGPLVSGLPPLSHFADQLVAYPADVIQHIDNNGRFPQKAETALSISFSQTFRKNLRNAIFLYRNLVHYVMGATNFFLSQLGSRQLLPALLRLLKSTSLSKTADSNGITPQDLFFWTALGRWCVISPFSAPSFFRLLTPSCAVHSERRLACTEPVENANSLLQFFDDISERLCWLLARRGLLSSVSSSQDFYNKETLLKRDETGEQMLFAVLKAPNVRQIALMYVMLFPCIVALLFLTTFGSRSPKLKSLLPETLNDNNGGPSAFQLCVEQLSPGVIRFACENGGVFTSPLLSILCDRFSNNLRHKKWKLLFKYLMRKSIVWDDSAQFKSQRAQTLLESAGLLKHVAAPEAN